MVVSKASPISTILNNLMAVIKKSVIEETFAYFSLTKLVNLFMYLVTTHPLRTGWKLINFQILYAKHKAECYGPLNAELFELARRMNIPFKYTISVQLRNDMGT